ncbi:MAG: large conductance mechanosensitive channel protein MscL [Faecalicoccus sp.]|nr:large conductance mechanosensitive channel protein MscL [Faecalicoccus sp.]
MKNFMKEFKEFAMRGNVMDMAVGVVIGGAFTAIVNSLVGDIITPLIGIITGGVDFTGLAVTVGDANITYGNFIQAIINFLLIALVVFTLIKSMNKMKKAEPAPEPEPEVDETLETLKQIRDLQEKK